MDQERPTQAIQTQEGRRLTCAHKIDPLVHTTLRGGVGLGKKRVGSP